ncbi:MAG: enoyl-CoA hydratase-related protein [Acidimicrobiales bacterium]
MIHTESIGAVALLTIDRPEKRNALDIEHCELLRRALEAALADGARCAVITGAGSAFCSGADLGNVYGPEFRTALYGMLGAITAAPVPVIAAVNGPAIGAGTQLAIACDLRVCASTLALRVPTAKLGLAVDPWTVRRLALLAGGGGAGHAAGL